MLELLKIVDDYKDLILEAERHIWKNPETGYKEYLVMYNYKYDNADSEYDKYSFFSYIINFFINIFIRNRINDLYRFFERKIARFYF